MTTDDTPARARAVLDAMGAVDETARVHGAVFTVEGLAASALYRLAEAVADYTAGGYGHMGPWWGALDWDMAEGEDETTAAQACGGCGQFIGGTTGGYHDRDCAALAIDAALAALAALHGGTTDGND